MAEETLVLMEKKSMEPFVESLSKDIAKLPSRKLSSETNTTESTLLPSCIKKTEKRLEKQSIDKKYKVPIKTRTSSLTAGTNEKKHTPKVSDELCTNMNSIIQCKKLPISSDNPPSILSEETTAVAVVEGNMGMEALNTIVCREWETEYKTIKPVKEVEKSFSMCFSESISSIPERDAVLWQIKDFADFRRASKVTKLPPLVSPSFGNGCHVLLNLYDKKKRISGVVQLPIMKSVKEGVVHIKISVVRPDMKLITSRYVELQVSVLEKNSAKTNSRVSSRFCLSKMCFMKMSRYQHLIVDNILRLRIELQYFPFDSHVFSGMNEMEVDSHAQLLQDIQNYCEEDTSQNVQIRRDDVVFHSCRFLLCARSKKFREILSAHTPSPKREWPLRLFQGSRCTSKEQALKCVTIRDVPTEILDQILIFIHTNTCPWIQDKKTDVLNLLELFECADVYGVNALLSRLIQALCEKMTVDNFMYMFEVSQRCQSEAFKQICTQFMDSIPGSQVATLMRATNHGYVEKTTS
ncbi:uncharacterized protein LOC128883344 isoform X2 [Hylaeus volcanicus]|uniref:uncharacterized protein LOC128883344 isoform X2 n=1 Tax=Hylaeus volcanicus TaxID=313075 RepID=UPI0023B79DE5|nr:uncharacterized protein LOC128883344 isoform X2 [Hylaeus volcanicus]